ncbi:MAG: type IV pilus assembly protein PilM [Patescibacteria group bacterium]
MNFKDIFKAPLNMFFPKKMVGIDIGTASVKVVEISRWGEGKTLENYGEIKSEFISKEPILNTQKSGNLFSSSSISLAIRAILDEAKIKTKSAIFSIPDFFTFSTSFEIPQMPPKEIAGAVRYNASQYLTLPVSEVTLDWKIMPDSKGDKNSAIKIFLIAVPNQVVQEYQKIAKDAGLEVYALEAEALSISRALVKNLQKTICLIDIGVQSSTVNIIDKGVLRRSYSFNFYGSKLSSAVSSVLGVDYQQAEEIKNKEGVIYSKPEVAQTLYLLIDPLLREIKTITAEFYQTEQKQVQEIYMTGGTASLPGLKEYLSESLKKNVYIPNCFSDFLYPPILEGTLKEMSPRFSVAMGVALSGLEA